MDRSYLSDQAVVAASRAFVCARLITFEDEEEAQLMRRLMRGRNLVNTVFTILDPTGARPLVRPGRSPRGAYDSGAEMAAAMNKIARRYPGKKRVKPAQLGLPSLEDVRIALNVTECDAQQLVILRGDAKKTEALEQRLVDLCWSDELVGRFLYVRAGDQTDWEAIAGSDRAPEDGVLIVRTERYGLKGAVVASLSCDVSAAKLKAQLLKAVESFAPAAVDTRKLRRAGTRAGLRWDTELPLPKRR